MNKIALTIGLFATLSQPALSQNMIDGSDINEVLNIAKGYGAASIEYNDEGKPAIRGRIKGNAYYLAFQNCTSDIACEDFFIQSYFLKPVVDYELVNEWNFNKRWTKVYYDADRDIVLEMDYNMGGGVNSINLDQLFSIWSQMIEVFHGDYFNAL